MNKVNLLIFFFLILSKATFSQGIKADSVVKAKYTTYNTKTIGAGNFTSILVVNSTNIYNEKMPRNRNINMVFQLNDKLAFLNAFKQVFSDERLQQLTPERYIHFTLYVNPDAHVM